MPLSGTAAGAFRLSDQSHRAHLDHHGMGSHLRDATSSARLL